VMLVRGIGALAIVLSLTPASFAGNHPGIAHRLSCTVVRCYVARYSASAAETWARGHGATDAESDAARRRLNDMPAQTAQPDAAAAAQTAGYAREKSSRMLECRVFSRTDREGQAASCRRVPGS